MFGKLRWKFVAINMTMVALVLAAVFAGICYTEYQRAEATVGEALNKAIEQASRHQRFDGAGQRKDAVLDRATDETAVDASSDDTAAIANDGAAKRVAPPAETPVLAPQPAYSAQQAADEESADDEADDADADDDEDDDADGEGGAAGLLGVSSSGNGADDTDDNVYGENDADDADNDADDADDADDISDTENDTDEAGEASDSDEAETSGQPEIGGWNQRNEPFTPVAVYRVTDDGGLAVVTGPTTAFIASDVLEQAAARTSSFDEGEGRLADLGLDYLKKTADDGATYVAFSDSSAGDAWQSLATTLALAAVGALLVFFVISLFLSSWALRPVREAWDRQRRFVTDASHELKTPLTVILANTSILLKHPERTIASQSQWVESTQVEAEGMQSLVGDMLGLAEVESHANLQTGMLDYSDVVAAEALQFESVAFERGCLLETDIAEGLTVNGDAARLRKMCATLIENACKYVDEGGSIRVTLSSAGRFCETNVANSGQAIPAEDLPHVFDRFYRSDKARTSGAGGFGLGLAIAREIAREHGGDITVESSKAAGTVFHVRLPLERP